MAGWTADLLVYACEDDSNEEFHFDVRELRTKIVAGPAQLDDQNAISELVDSGLLTNR